MKYDSLNIEKLSVRYRWLSKDISASLKNAQAFVKFLSLFILLSIKTNNFFLPCKCRSIAGSCWWLLSHNCTLVILADLGVTRGMASSGVINGEPSWIWGTTKRIEKWSFLTPEGSQVLSWSGKVTQEVDAWSGQYLNAQFAKFHYINHQKEVVGKLLFWK